MKLEDQKNLSSYKNKTVHTIFLKNSPTTLSSPFLKPIVANRK